MGVVDPYRHPEPGLSVFRTDSGARIAIQPPDSDRVASVTLNRDSVRALIGMLERSIEEDADDAAALARIRASVQGTLARMKAREGA